MTSSRLKQAVDAWAVQAAAASRFLMSLYRGLGDGKQASTAAQAGAPAEERVRRLRLTARVMDLQSAFGMDHSEETQKEACAWRALVEAHAGIAAFHSLVDGHPEKPRGLKGAMSSTASAFQRSLRGYRVAFPEEVANAGIFDALQAATDKCTEACLADLGGKEGPEHRTELAAVIHKTILEALVGEADLKTDVCMTPSSRKATPCS